MVPDDCRDRVANHHFPGHLGQLAILLPGVLNVVGAFQLDADRKIIASIPAGPGGNPGVPGTMITGDKLNQCAATTNQKMG